MKLFTVLLNAENTIVRMYVYITVLGACFADFCSLKFQSNHEDDNIPRTVKIHTHLVSRKNCNAKKKDVLHILMPLTRDRLLSEFVGKAFK